MLDGSPEQIDCFDRIGRHQQACLKDGRGQAFGLAEMTAANAVVLCDGRLGIGRGLITHADQQLNSRGHFRRRAALGLQRSQSFDERRGRCFRRRERFALTASGQRDATVQYHCFGMERCRFGNPRRGEPGRHELALIEQNAALEQPAGFAVVLAQVGNRQVTADVGERGVEARRSLMQVAVGEQPMDPGGRLRIGFQGLAQDRQALGESAAAVQGLAE